MVKLKCCAKIPSSGLRGDVTLFYYHRLTSYASVPPSQMSLISKVFAPDEIFSRDNPLGHIQPADLRVSSQPADLPRLAPALRQWLFG
jgi:hypothetical protein